MSQQTINPYKTLGTQHTSGLDSIKTALAVGMTFDQVNVNVVTSVQAAYVPAPNAFDAIEYLSILPNAVNDYVNKGLGGKYNEKQIFIIQQLLKGVLKVPVQSIKNFILDVEDNLTRTGLTMEEQLPILIATVIGAADYDYWIDKVITTPANPWYTVGPNAYFSSNAAINYANIPYWVEASMVGALCGANKGSSFGLVDPPRVVGVDLVAALSGSVGLAAGKVMYQWIPRIQCLDNDSRFNNYPENNPGIDYNPRMTRRNM